MGVVFTIIILAIYAIVVILLWEYFIKPIYNMYIVEGPRVKWLIESLKKFYNDTPHLFRHIILTEFFLIFLAYFYVHYLRGNEFHADIFLGEVVTTIILAIAININWKYMIQPIKESEARLLRIEDSPIGNYISVTTNKYTQNLALAVNDLLKNASPSGPDQKKEINKAEEVVRLIGKRLSPDSNVKTNIIKEELMFQEVTNCLRFFPKRMLFTDIRSPGLWDLDNNLHIFTLAVIESFLGRGNNDKKKYTMTKMVANAITQCINNFDRLLFSWDRALAHSRRWIGCEYLNSDLKDSEQKIMIARALFHGHHDPDQRDLIVGNIKDLLDDSEKDCNNCPQKTICDKHVDFSIAKNLSPEDLIIKSIFDKSILNKPCEVYWCTGLQNSVIDFLHQEGVSIDVEILGNETNDVFDSCRFLFWKKEYLNDEEAQLRLWDTQLGVPIFWFDVDDGILNSDHDAKKLKDYFITQGRDYIYLKKTSSGTVAYKTNVQKDGSTSEKLNSCKQEEFLKNCNEVLKLLCINNEQGEDLPLLAAHAHFLYKKYQP